MQNAKCKMQNLGIPRYAWNNSLYLQLLKFLNFELSF